MVWPKTDLGPKFWLSDNLVGSDYTSVFSARLTKFGPGGGSSPHSHTYNHAFYFLSGTCSVLIGEQTWEDPVEQQRVGYGPPRPGRAGRRRGPGRLPWARSQKAAAAASATVVSCSPSPPLTPTAPTTWPSRSSGMPPAKIITRPLLDSWMP